MTMHDVKINIAGLTKFSTIDWPGKIVAVCFLQGCPFRCNYCYNWSILDPFVECSTTFDEVITFLEKRYGELDGLVFSGGEPTMQPQIINAAKAVKEMGFLVGLHTMGAFPTVLQRLVKYIDWVGFDVKAPFCRPNAYDNVTRSLGYSSVALESLKLLIKNNITVQTRTTPDSSLWENNFNDLIIKDLNKIMKEQNRDNTLSANHIFNKVYVPNYM